ncbi:universal stress protein [Nakamurella leprariae]|uniref:Universal stress protein n=1 Tax=Nakamurella leprariae TaxID=2803911 RepID=A0A938YE07_9ACTN|nr:universal stress protein [Nakamurella leprariae]MBM9468977.1 universal stress protein [Nakamurella leprariae]
MAEDRTDLMSTPGRTNVVVAGVDGSEAALHATRWAAEQAQARSAALLLVHGWDLPRLGLFGRRGDRGDRGDDGLSATLREDGDRMLADAARAVTEQFPGVPVSCRLAAGRPSEALREASDRALLVVVGARRGRLAGALLGSTSWNLVLASTTPVAVVRGDHGNERHRRTEGPVVVGVDGSAISEAAVGYAFEEAAVRGVRLVALSCWERADVALGTPSLAVHRDPSELEAEERTTLAEQLAGWRERYPDVEVQAVIDPGRPTSVLLERSGTAALLVVGSRGLSGLAGLALGSTSQALVSNAACPVVVVRPRHLVGAEQR